jgi:hypothetical protein
VDWRVVGKEIIMLTKEEFEFYPVKKTDKQKIRTLCRELEKTLLERSDGVCIVIERSSEFPPLDGKPLMVKFHCHTWDIAA